MKIRRKKFVGIALIVAVGALYFLVRQFNADRLLTDGVAGAKADAAVATTASRESIATPTNLPSATTKKLTPNPDSIFSRMRSEAPATTPATATAPELEICGLAQADVQRLSAQPATANIANANLALGDVAATFVQSDAAEKKALGLYLAAIKAGWDALEAGANLSAAKKQECEAANNCATASAARLQQSLHLATQKAVAPLAALAYTSKHPRVYATAFYACQLDGARDGPDPEAAPSSAQQPSAKPSPRAAKPASAAGGTCGDINVARWALLDIDNAVPWLLLAAELTETLALAERTPSADSGDAKIAAAREANADIKAAIDADVSRAILAPQYDSRLPAVASVFDHWAVNAAPQFLQATLAHELIGFQQGQTPANAAASICAAPFLGLERRRLDCDAIANKMLKHDPTHAAVTASIAVGKNLRWGGARIAQLAQENTVGTMLLAQQTASNIALNCENVAALNAHLQAILRKGERAVAQDLITKSGKTIAELAALK